MQHRTRSPGPRHRQVDACLGGGPTRASDNSACFIDLHDVLSGETPLVHAAGGDRQPKGVTRDHRAEVATGPQYPTAGMALAPDLGERIGQHEEAHGAGIGARKAPSSSSIVGRTSKVTAVDTASPPITAIASRRCSSALEPNPSARG